MSLYVCGYTSPYTLKKKCLARSLHVSIYVWLYMPLYVPLYVSLYVWLYIPLRKPQCATTQHPSYGKRDLRTWQKRPTYMAKETYVQ